MNDSPKTDSHGTEPGPDDLLALRYVQGELSPDEATEFEARLEAEPALCDEVEHAVWTMEAVSADAPVAARTEDRSAPAVRLPVVGSWRRAVAVVAGIAAAWWLVVLFTPSMDVEPPASVQEQAGGEGASEEHLLDLWVSLSDSDADSTETSADGGLEIASHDGVEVDAAEDDELPPWIWTALESS